jgi:hypothetical protein
MTDNSDPYRVVADYIPGRITWDTVVGPGKHRVIARLEQQRRPGQSGVRRGVATIHGRDHAGVVFR